MDPAPAVRSATEPAGDLRARRLFGRRAAAASDLAASPFRADRDRIVSSPFFARLGGVTQVISPGGSGLLVHNRLTHSLKVAQVGRAVAERLAADERYRTLLDELGGCDPDVVEAVKWRKPSNPSGVPVWEHGGMICTGETYKDKVKLTFARGASLQDPSGLFNSSLDGNVRRAIDIREGDRVDEEAFVALVGAAVRLNASRARG